MRVAAFVSVVCCLVLAVCPAQAKTSVEKSLREQIAVLASDDFEGRAPGTAGEQKTLNYITQIWQKAGLRPGTTEASWLVPVPLVQRSPGSAKFSFATREKTLRFVADEIVLTGREASYQKKALPLLFGGYGIKEDGTPLDNVAGKAVLLLFDQPDFGPAATRVVRARREALVKAGAEAVFVVANNGAGAWSAVRRQLLTRPLALQSREIRAPLEGAFSSEFAVAMVTAAGRDWDKLRAHAREKNFVAEDLGIAGDFDVTTDVHRFNSQNVIGKISGKKPETGAVLYMAHWDHLGICQPESATDKICNGAVDNASGIAVLTEIARGLSKSRFDRDIYFVATTAEESGLLGAYAFADNPPVPLDKIMVAFNVDTIAVAPAGAKVAIVGRGTTSLDPIIDGVAARLGRPPEMSTESNSFVQRQDGWALGLKGVPAVMVGGAFADIGRLQAFLGSNYHKPDDELTDKTELGGAAEDVKLHIELGRTFADTRKYKGK